MAERRQDNERDGGHEGAVNAGGANLPAPRQDAAPAERSPEPSSEPRPEPGSELSARPASELSARPASELSARPSSEILDEEELRQFRQFQEFQRFMAHQQENSGELPPAGSPDAEPSGWRNRAPAWLTALGGKILTAALVLIAVAAGAAWAINHYLGGSDEQSSAELAEQGGKKAEATKLYASDPYEAVRDVYGRIAQPDPSTGLPQVEKVCLRFDEQGRSQFTANMGAATCADAVIALNKDVRHVTNYIDSLPSSMPYEVYDEVSRLKEGESYRIDSCEAARSEGDTIIGGPALGTFVVTKIPEAKGDQWLITGHEPGPRTCPKPKRTAPK